MPAGNPLESAAEVVTVESSSGSSSPKKPKTEPKAAKDAIVKTKSPSAARFQGGQANTQKSPKKPTPLTINTSDLQPLTLSKRNRRGQAKLFEPKSQNEHNPNDSVLSKTDDDVPSHDIFAEASATDGDVHPSLGPASKGQVSNEMAVETPAARSAEALATFNKGTDDAVHISSNAEINDSASATRTSEHATQGVPSLMTPDDDEVDIIVHPCEGSLFASKHFVQNVGPHTHASEGTTGQSSQDLEGLNAQSAQDVDGSVPPALAPLEVDAEPKTEVDAEQGKPLLTSITFTPGIFTPPLCSSPKEKSFPKWCTSSMNADPNYTFTVITPPHTPTNLL